MTYTLALEPADEALLERCAFGLPVGERADSKQKVPKRSLRDFLF